MKEKSTTKICKKCKVEIPKHAKHCPACGAKQKMGFLKKVLIVFAVLFLFSMFFGDSEESSDVSFTESESGEETQAVKFEKSEIYNDKNVVITISDFIEDYSDVDIQFTIENNSKKDYAFSAHSFSINGLMAGGTEMTSDVDVPSGKKGSFTISVDKEWLTDNGIDHLGRLDVLFWAYYEDFKDWDTGVVKVKTNLYDEEKMYKPNGDEVYSDKNMSLYLISKDENEYTFSVHNKTSYDVGYYIENCSVNDWSYESDNYLFDVYDEPIHGESYFVYEFEVYDSFMEDNNIESIEKMEFNLMMEDDYYENISDIWEAKSDKITIE